MSEISFGVFKKLFEGSLEKEEYSAQFPYLIVQLYKSKPLTDKMRFTISDGVHILQAIYSKEDPNPPDPYSVIKISDYDVFRMEGGRPVVCFNTWELVRTETEKIGNAEPYNKIAGEATTNDKSPAPEQQQAPRAQPKPASRPVSSSKPHANIIPIEALSPYSNTWTIRAKVTMKGDIRKFQTKRGEGQLFNVHLQDETGEIRATGFGDAVDMFYSRFQEGGVYYISRCSVTLAKKQFSNLTNEYELRFEQDSIIEKSDEALEIRPNYTFKPLDKLTEVNNNEFTDVIAVIRDVGDMQHITSRSGRDFDKRELQLVDSSQTSVQCTFWGKSATQFSASPGSVIALKGVKVGDFGGRTLSVGATTGVAINPDIPEGHELKGWFDANGKDQSFSKIKAEVTADREPPTLIAQAKQDHLGMTEAGDFFTIRASLAYINAKNSLTYLACPNCRKKLSEQTAQEPNTYHCEKCGSDFTDPNYQYAFSFSMADMTDRIWLMTFNVGEKLLGLSPGEFVKQTDADNDKQSQILASVQHKEFLIRVRAQQEEFNDEKRVRYRAVGIYPVNHAQQAMRLAEFCEKY